MSQRVISIIGAKENNLKDISCIIPLQKLVSVVGLSGSGKSSLVFDTLFKESQKRLEASFLSVNRQLISTKVDAIEGLSHVVGVRSKVLASRYETLATLSGLYFGLASLFVWHGQSSCHLCGSEVISYSSKNILDELFLQHKGEVVCIYAPFFITSVQEIDEISRNLLSRGYLRIVLFEQEYELGSALFNVCKENLASEWEEGDELKIKVLIDIVEVSGSNRTRLLQSIETAFSLCSAEVFIEGKSGNWLGKRYSQIPRCILCRVIQKTCELDDFNYFRAENACEFCKGLGANCKACHGARVSKVAQCRMLKGKIFSQVVCFNVKAMLEWIDAINFPESSPRISIYGLAETSSLSQKVLSMLHEKLSCLCDLGLAYLQLNRSAQSLSTGEALRVQMSQKLSDPLSGVVYLLDEPSSGLHPSDRHKLLMVLRKLIAKENSVIMTEHDLALISESDYLLELGLDSGDRGGELVAEGNVESIIAQGTRTGQYLNKFKKGDFKRIENKDKRRNSAIRLLGATKHNLKNIDVSFSFPSFIVVSGVSGSGKSSLVFDCLYPALRYLIDNKTNRLTKEQQQIFGVKKVHIASNIKRIICGSELKLLKNPRSIVATISGAFKYLRDIYSLCPESKIHGLTSKHFSFNSQLGWCSKCKGCGYLEEVAYEDGLNVCSLCDGRRFSRTIEKVRYKGLTLSEVLELTIEQCSKKFSFLARLNEIMKLFIELGLGYLKLSQMTHTLSSGEKQRLRLASDVLAKKDKGTLYLFDEPTNGLHAFEVELLVEVFRNLVVKGNGVIAISHNGLMLNSCDELIELGPEAGEFGGKLLARLIG